MHADICYATDNNYVQLMAVSMVSLIKNCNDIEQIHFHILADGLDDIHKENLRKMCLKYNVEISIYDVSELIKDKIPGVIHTNLFPSTAWARLLIEYVLPSSVNRLLYIDCDTLVFHSIKPLFSCDMNGKLILASPDVLGNWHRERLSLPPQFVYINSGVLLIDFRRWQTEKAFQRIKDLLPNSKKKFDFADQDVFNLYFADNIEPSLDFTYNAMYPMFLKAFRPQRHVILHYNGNTYRHQIPKLFRLLNMYNCLTPWVDTPFISNRSRKERFGDAVLLLEELFLDVIRFLLAMLFPKKQKLIKKSLRILIGR